MSRAPIISTFLPLTWADRMSYLCIDGAGNAFNSSLTVPHHPPLFAANKHMTENQLIRKMKPKTTHCFLPL